MAAGFVEYETGNATRRELQQSEYIVSYEVQALCRMLELDQA